MIAISLFSGLGGLDIAAGWAGIETVLQVEIDPHCQTILRKHWPDIPKWEDVKTLDASAIIDRFGRIDLVYGGPPCQPVSIAGRRKAAGDERNMWPEFFRLIRGIRPPWIVAENPTGVLSAPYKEGEPKGSFFGWILSEMAEMGYVCGWGVWGACDVENDEEGTALPPESAGCAPHQRERVFIVAHAHHAGLQVAGHEPGHETIYAENRTEYGGDVGDAAGQRGFTDGGNVGDTDHKRCKKLHAPPGDKGMGQPPGESSAAGIYGRRPESGLGGNAGWPAGRVHRWPAGRGAPQFAWEPPRVIPGGQKGRAARLKMLGNMVVPEQAFPLFAEIADFYIKD